MNFVFWDNDCVNISLIHQWRRFVLEYFLGIFMQVFNHFWRIKWWLYLNRLNIIHKLSLNHFFQFLCPSPHSQFDFRLSRHRILDTLDLKAIKPIHYFLSFHLALYEVLGHSRHRYRAFSMKCLSFIVQFISLPRFFLPSSMVPRPSLYSCHWSSAVCLMTLQVTVYW